MNGEKLASWWRDQPTSDQLKNKPGYAESIGKDRRMNGEINWGPEIRVDGVRPEWLGSDRQPIMVHNSIGWHQWAASSVDPAEVAWVFNDKTPNVDLIRLPADHPHYAASQPRTAPSGGEVGPEVVERMIGLVRRLSGGFYMHGVNDDGIEQVQAVIDAKNIVALLPEPVDPAIAFVEQVFSAISDGGPIRDDAVKSLMREAFDAGREFAKKGTQL